VANKKDKLAEAKAKIDDLIDHSFFDVKGLPGNQEVIEIIVNAVIGLCTAWWSIRELLDYFHHRMEYRSVLDDKPTSSGET
jgi:uncharacterized membrane protein YpjA